MKTRILLLPAFILSVAGCQPTTTSSQNTTTGALAGAAIGAIVADDDERLEGALIGRTSTPGNCVYRDAYNRQYIAPCP